MAQSQFSVPPAKHRLSPVPVHTFSKAQNDLLVLTTLEEIAVQLIQENSFKIQFLAIFPDYEC